MGKIKLWYLFAASAAIWALMTIESAVDGKYILLAVNFLAFITNAYAAYRIRKYGD